MKKIKALKTSFVLALVASAVCGFSTWQSGPVKAIESAEQLFVEASGVTITQDAEAPDTFLDYKGNTVARDFDLGMKGTLLSTSAIGSSVQLAPTFSGDFSMTFRAYSDVNFGSDNPNEFNVYSYVMTPYADLREISFIFEDSTGKKFTIAIAAGEKYNVITPAARVITGKTAFGYHYLNDATMENNTPAQNAGGYFTRIGGTTFCNVARTGGKQLSSKSHPLTFGFDADTMEVYVIHYGTTVEKVERRLVADLDDTAAMGLSSITSFEDYKVTVQFTDISIGKDANVIIYDVNGQSLEGTKFTDNEGPVTSVKKAHDAVKGEKYLLPAPRAFDLLEGKLAYNGEVSVNGGAYKVYSADNAVTTTWSEGCYFIPDSVGEYTVSYTAKDGKNNVGTAKTFTVNAVEELPEYSFKVVEGNYEALERSSVVYGAGANFTLYPAQFLSSLISGKGVSQAQVTLLKGGAVYEGINNLIINDAQEVELQAGEYKLVYSFVGYPELMKKEYTFSVSESAPIFNFTNAVPGLVESGTEFTVPKATAVIGETKTLASASLYDPNGALVALSNNKAMIDKIGYYKITYRARLNNVAYSYDVYFNAAYSTNNAFIADGETVIAQRGDSGNLTVEKIGGIKLNYFAPDKYATYSKTIDLSKLNPDEPFIKVMVLPKKIGTLDFWQYTIRLTDVNNAKNYVDIVVFKGSWGNAYSYVKAGGSNQKPGGWEMGKFLTSFNAGTPILYSFTGEASSGTEQIELFYDYADQSISVGNIKRPGYVYDDEVADLDGTDCFSENYLFGGFSTGEVYLSIAVQEMQIDEAVLLVTEVNGINLSQEWIDDKAAPQIGIDTLGYAENALPLGLVNVAYPIFNASAFDSADGKTNVSVKIYRDYQTLNQLEIAPVDGKFTPPTVGEYTIVYSATDKSGNRNTKEIKVSVVDALEAFTYAFNKPLDIEYSLGEYLYISQGVAEGGSGKALAQVSVIAPNGQVIEKPNGTLVDQEGTYKVQVKFTDFLGREYTEIYSINAQLSNAPILYEVSLPAAMVNGVTYTLPDFEASDYSTGSYQEPTKSIKVIYNGVESVLGADRKFTPNVANHQDEIQVVYSATNANGISTSYTYKVKGLVVTNDAGIDMSAYFALDNMTAGEKTASYVEFDTKTDGAGLTFVNPLIASNLALEVYVPKAKNNFNSLTITLTDVEDKNNAISFTIVKNNSKVNYSFLDCEGERFEIAGNFFDLTSYGLSVSFNNTSKFLFDRNANKNLLKVKTNVEGEAFEGFASGKVYLSMKLNGVEGASAVRVMLIGNQYFSNITADRVLPQIQLNSFIPRTTEVNVPFTVPSAIAADVLSAEVTLSVKITKGSKTIYEGAIDKDYTFTPTDYGNYKIAYTAKAGGRSATSSYFISVKDRIKPTMTLSGSKPTTGKVGQAINLPTVTVSDNYSENMRVWIYITEPTGRMITLEEGATSYVPTMKGKHRVSYYVCDEYANYVYEKFVITVL